MAYVPTFSRIDDEINRQRATGGEAAAGGGEAVGGGAGGVGSAPSAPGYTQSNYASGKKILEANKNERLGLDVTQPYREQLSQDAQKENEGWGAYQAQTAAERAKGQINDADVEAYASGGDEAAKNKVRDSLNAAYKPTQYSSYSSSVSMGDVGRLGTSAGLQGAIQQAQEKRGNYGYGQGMSALDSLLYSRRPETAQQIQGLGKDVAGLRAQQQANTQQFQRDQQELPAAIKAQQDAARSRIKAMADQTLAQDSQTSFRRDLEAQAQQDARRNMLSTVQNQLRAGAAGFDDQAAKEEYLKRIQGLSANDINTVVGGQLSGGPAYSEQAANRFNRLSELIDGKDQIKAATAGDVYNANINSKELENLQKKLSGASKTAAAGRVADKRKVQLESAAKEDRKAAEKQLVSKYGFKDDAAAQKAIDKFNKAGPNAGIVLSQGDIALAKKAKEYLAVKQQMEDGLKQRSTQRYQES